MTITSHSQKHAPQPLRAVSAETTTILRFGMPEDGRQTRSHLSASFPNANRYPFSSPAPFFPKILGAILCLAFALSGCATHKVILPVVIKSDPTRDELIGAVNQNSVKINSLSSDDGTLGVSATPWTAKCRLAYERESKIRLLGTLNMVGPVVDFGSDGKNFWFWFKNQEPNQISYCRLDEYAKSAFKDQIPVDPVWFPEAIGVVHIDAAEVIEGPVIDRDGTIKLTVKKTRPEGDYIKYMYIEPKTAAIKRQDIKNPVTNEILTVSCDEFQYNNEQGVVLPKKITVSRSMGKDRIYIDLGTLKVNQADQNLASLFTLPSAEELGAPLVNIGSTPNPTPNTWNNQDGEPQTEATQTGGIDSIPPADPSYSTAPSQSGYRDPTEEVQPFQEGNGLGLGTGNSNMDSRSLVTSVPPPSTGTQTGLSTGRDIPVGASFPDSTSLPNTSTSASIQFHTMVTSEKD